MFKNINKWIIENTETQAGQVYIVTGGNSGLGAEIVTHLLRNKATVVLANRSPNKTQRFVGQLRVEGNFNESYESDLKNLDFKTTIKAPLDLADTNSIINFANAVKQKYTKIDGLINNAGIMAVPESKTKQDFEMQMGVNHLGHFLLTSLLLPLLKESEDARVVNMSSSLHKNGKLDFDNLMLEGKYDRWLAYSNSKLANLLFTIELQKRLEANRIDNVRAFSTHPGFSSTPLIANGPLQGRFFPSLIAKPFVWIAHRLLAQSPRQGALGAVYAACNKKAKAGAFYGPADKNGFAGNKGFPVENKIDPKIVKNADAKKLWANSEELLGIKFRV